MNLKIYCGLVSILWLGQPGHSSLQCVSVLAATNGRPSPKTIETVPAAVNYYKSVRYNIYTFTVAATDSGAVRDVQIKAYRGELLLTNFRISVDGAVAGVEVADLDNNRFPELYVYSNSDGSGSFGRVYGWQFLPERKVDITPVNWRLTTVNGYMGHDSLWVEQRILCRKYPVYRPGDANAEPTGGVRMMRYQLRPVGEGFALVAEK